MVLRHYVVHGKELYLFSFLIKFLRHHMESHDNVEATKKQSPLRVVEVDFVFSPFSFLFFHLQLN